MWHHAMLPTPPRFVLHLRAQPLDVDLFDVAAVDRHSPLSSLVEPQQQPHAGGLSTSRGAHKRHGLTGGDIQAEALRVLLGAVDLPCAGKGIERLKAGVSSVCRSWGGACGCDVVLVPCVRIRCEHIVLRPTTAGTTRTAVVICKRRRGPSRRNLASKLLMCRRSDSSTSSKSSCRRWKAAVRVLATAVWVLALDGVKCW